MDDRPARIDDTVADWRDLPENQRAGGTQRWTWLDLLAIHWEANEDGAFKALFWSIYDSLIADGVDGEVASRIAQRAAANAMLQLHGRIKQKDAARVLGVSKRQATDDIALVRAVLVDGSVREAAARPLPPVPNRIKLTLPARAGR